MLPWMLLPGAAAAHGAPQHLAYDPLAVILLGLLGALLAGGAIRLWRRVGPGHGLRYPQAAGLLGALLLLWLALVWPLEPLAEVSAAAHMTQHMLLILGIPPLLLLGRAGAVALHGLPRPAGRRMGSGVRRLRGLWRLLCRPGVAFMLHLVAVWIWHAPAAFEAALQNYWIHLAEHLTLLLTGILFWSGVLEGAKGNARSVGNAAVLVLGTLMHTGMLGALLTFAPTPVYPSYQYLPPGPLTALEDQQLAGLVMWVPGGFVYLVAIMVILGAWLRRAERRLA